jgi:hypothetical protein
LQREGEELLCGDVPRARHGVYRLDPALRPKLKHSGNLQQRTKTSGKEQAISGRSRPAPGAAEALQERGHSRRRVDLDDPVEVADVHA